MRMEPFENLEIKNMREGNKDNNLTNNVPCTSGQTQEYTSLGNPAFDDKNESKIKSPETTGLSVEKINSNPSRDQAISINEEIKNNGVNSSISKTNHKYNEIRSQKRTPSNSTPEVSKCSPRRHFPKLLIPKRKQRVTDEIAADGTWQVRTYTGYIITMNINLNRGKPLCFASESAEMMWHTANEINMMRLKRQLQYGEYIPGDAVVDVDPFPLKVPSTSTIHVVLESEEKRIEKVSAWDAFKKNALENEKAVVDSVIDLRECFCREHNIKKGLEILDSILNLKITPLILKKNPFVVFTIQYLCLYETPVQCDVNKILAENVRQKAQNIYNKIKMMFKVPDGDRFEEQFKNQSMILWKVYGFATFRMCELVKDPTLPIMQC